MNTNHPEPIIQNIHIPTPSSIALAKEKVLLPKEETLGTKQDQAVTVIDAQPLTVPSSGPIPPTHPPRKSRRRGRVASLPKLQRDMVNRMLWNGVPYKNIVVALDDAGFTLIERNISNWATGGYLEWRLEQEAVLENRL